ncbi:MAG: hypothetical protein ACM3U1_00845 [Chloroflexota bacterium]
MATITHIRAQKKPIGHILKVVLSLLLFLPMPLVIWFEYNKGYIDSKLYPKEFSWTPTIIFLVIEVLVMLALLASLFIHLRRYYIANRLSYAGAFTNGKVSKKEKAASKSGAVGYFLTIEYTLFGQSVALRQKTSKMIYESMEPGKRVAIKYLPSDPTIARAEL